MNREQRRRFLREKAQAATRGPLFTTLTSPSDEDLDKGADALQANNGVAFRVDPLPAYALFVSSADRGLPYEVDFVVTGDPTAAPVMPLPMKRGDLERLRPWADRVCRELCRRWKERHPPA